MKIEAGPLLDTFIFTPLVRGDERGFFMETFKDSWCKEAGITNVFVQDNHSRSAKHILRGLHFQWEPPMGKLMRVTRGAAFLVAVDIRKGSPTLGEWFGIEVSEENKKQIYAPAGFARGFCSLTDDCEVQYKCTGEYNQNAEAGIAWNDPEIGIKWPIDDPILSERDQNAQTLKQWLSSPDSDNFIYQK